VVRVTGKGAARMFANESGGHRWQRVPPNERKGRVHTSTVTVAVLREPTPTEMVIRDADLEWATCRGSGAGGQHRNKTETAVVVKHLPSGLAVRCEAERSQLQNKATALGLLRARLLATKDDAATAAHNANRREQVGSPDVS
jgi:peptide chain release factor 1